MPTLSQRKLELVATKAAARSNDRTRHKCFVSYRQDDEVEVKKFIDDYGDIFIAKVLGVSDEDDFIDSTETEYLRRRIRELYLTDSTVTIVLIGKCTWARRYVDWEIASTLRNDPNNKRSGLLGITLPSVGDGSGRAPERLSDNLRKDGESYARRISYPTSKDTLGKWIEDAFSARNAQARYDLINNMRDHFKNNRSCP